MKPGNCDGGEKQQQQKEAKGPPTAPLPPPAYYQDQRANNISSSSSSSQQQYPQYPRIVAAVRNDHQQLYNNNNTNNSNSTWDPEAAAAAEVASQFAEADARAGFVRRVLSIVAAQLVLTAAMTLAFFYSRLARSFLVANAWTVPASWVVGLAVSTTLACSETARRRHPHNLATLAVFTISFGYMVAATSAAYSAQSVVTAAAVTAAVSLGALAIAAFSSLDFTRHAGALLLSSWAFLVAIVVGGLLHSSAAVLVLSAVGAVLFSLYLVFDLQMIMSGSGGIGGIGGGESGGGGAGSSSLLGAPARHRREVELSPDEYVYGALLLYLDVVNVFVNVLQLVQAAGDSS